MRTSAFFRSSLVTNCLCILSHFKNKKLFIFINRFLSNKLMEVLCILKRGEKAWRQVKTNQIELRHDDLLMSEVS